MKSETTEEVCFRESKKNMENSWQSGQQRKKAGKKLFGTKESKLLPPQLPPEPVSFPLLPLLPLLPLFPLHLRDPTDLKAIKFTWSAVLSGLETKSTSIHLNIPHHQLFHHVEGMH